MDSTLDTTLSVSPVMPSRWALATQGDPVALGELAASYWYGVYVWWRRSGLNAEPAASATVGSFTRWLTTRPPSAEDSGAGLMREWLPARLAELAAEGLEVGGVEAIAIEAEWAEEHYGNEPDGEADAVFHRRWTLTVLEFTMQALRAEYVEKEQETLFAEVAPFIAFADAADAQYAAAAERAGVSVGALRLAVFEFRARHRELLRGFVADTLADPADVGGEITALLCVYDLPADPHAPPAPLPTAIRTFKPDELLARAMNTVQMSNGGTGRWKPPSDEEVARLFPQFEMRGMIGRGGMGAVYRARQVALDREVAIKLLPLEVSVDQAFADRFVREARAMAKLNHPNIVSVFGFGTTAEGHLYFFMEYVEGANVSQIIRGPGLEPEQALAIAGQVCTALAYAHGKGVIHRDIKPANVMVGTDGVAKVADFGLARVEGADPAEYGQTVTGAIMGTAEYMSPEQKRGMGVDHRADIYSVGAMLYEMLCKEPPHGAIEPPSRRVGCDTRLDHIVLKAMSRTPEGRYQSATEMQLDIEAARTPLPVPPHPNPAPRMNAGGNRLPTPPAEKSSAGLLVSVVLVALVAGAFFLLNRKEAPSARPVAQAPEPGTPAPLSTPVPISPSSTPDPVAPPSTPDFTGPPMPAVAAQPEPMTKEAPRPPEKPPAPQPPIPTGPKDLLATVDVARDAVSGQWQMTPGGLAVKTPGGRDFELLGFNCDPPEEYDFEIEFTIQDGNREVSQALPFAGRTILWKLGCHSNKEGQGAFALSTLDGNNPGSKARTEALVRLPLLKLNQRYRSVVEVRRGSFRAVLDGKELLRWSGDFQRLSGEDAFSLPNPRQLGVAAWSTSVLFHKAELRLPGSIVRVAVAAAPAASALVAASNDPRLGKLEEGFQARFESDAQKPYLAAIAALNQSYLANGLTRARAAAQAKGSLAEVTVLDEEKAGIEKGDGVPATDDEDTPDALKTLRATYRTAMTKYAAERAKTGGQVYDLYLAAIKGYEAELTRADKIDEAKKVRALRDEVAEKKAELARPAAEPPKAAAAPAPVAPDPKTAAAPNAREAVKSLLAKGGSCRIVKGAFETDVLTEQELPPDKFKVIGLTLDRRQWKGAPPTDADAKIFRGINSLRTIWAYTPGLGDAAFVFLAGNADLTTVHIHTDADVLTDRVLQHLAASEKLTDFTVLYAKNFTGRGLEKMRWLPLLTKADFHGSGISNEGLKELAGATMLTDLNLELCSGFTDAGLAKLTTLTRLQTLNVRDTGVSPAGIEAFKKALPKCQVTK